MVDDQLGQRPNRQRSTRDDTAGQTFRFYAQSSVDKRNILPLFQIAEALPCQALLDASLSDGNLHSRKR